jgi:sugar transferase (PEP-CTERM system associated)
MLRFLKQYYHVRSAFFVLGEALLILFSVVISYLLLVGIGEFTVDKLLFIRGFFIVLVCQACLYYNELYDFKIITNFKELNIRLLQAIGVASIIIGVFYFFLPAVIIGRAVSLVSIVFIIISVISWRFFYNLVLDQGWMNQKIMILGSSTLVNHINEEIINNQDCGYDVELIIPESEEGSGLDFRNYMADYGKDGIEGYASIPDTAKKHNIRKIVVGFKEKRGALPIRQLLDCRMSGIEVIDINSFYEMLMGKFNVTQINPAWLIFSVGFNKSLTLRFFKRCADLALSIIMLIVFFPLMVVISLLIKMDSKGPAIFSQERVGYKKNKYFLYKFRSMVLNAEENGPVWAQADDKRVTNLGRWIRKYRIDELPQLFNILKGEMSFIGPRPEREFFVEELESTVPYYGNRFYVKPGLTGWAQVNYPYGATIEDALEKLNYELFYIKNMSMLLDITILIRTVKTVLFGQGAR